MGILVHLALSSLLLAFASGAPQVLSEIDTYDDLLAIESQFIENEIEPSVQKILPPPTGFNGERFSAPPLKFASGFPQPPPRQQPSSSNFIPQPSRNSFAPPPSRPSVVRPSFNRPTVNRPPVNRPTVNRPSVSRPSVSQPNDLQIDPNDPHSYSFSFETPEMKRDEAGQPKGSDSYVQTGGWEYVGDDGRVYSVRFIADENGFRPVGNHLPTPPPLPPALQRFEDARNGRLSKSRRQG
eukprot:TRINITY_DN8173_c0_g1_i1.p1 TRINITY_DN8173_c0_g1~~TRINITY_DN8173_c0_g1_i1.p1  ORF type:complete len:239 (+),score=59.61 TRINITY_DN8173_c0_g1_i1:138-854(+)